MNAALRSAVRPLLALTLGLLIASCGSEGFSRGGPARRGAAPVIELVIEPDLMRGSYRIRVYEDGTVTSSGLGPASSDEYHIGPRRAGDAVAGLLHLGFQDITEASLEAEMRTVSAAGRGLAVADGEAATLILREHGRTHAVSWTSPDLYRDMFPSAHLMHSFADCVDQVLGVLRQAAAERNKVAK
jgi:hypothetical protein